MQFLHVCINLAELLYLRGVSNSYGRKKSVKYFDMKNSVKTDRYEKLCTSLRVW